MWDVWTRKIITCIGSENRHKHADNTLDVTSLKPWFFPHSSSSHMGCLCLSDSPGKRKKKTKKQKTKQGLIHLNKRVVQSAMAALRTDSKEWDFTSMEGHSKTECRLWRKEEVYISGKSFSEQRDSKINKQYMCLSLGSGTSDRKIPVAQG